MSKTVIITPSANDLPPGWTIDWFREVLQRAADAWSFPNVPCGVKLVVGEPRSEWRAVPDGTNLVVFRSKAWCHNERCGPTSTYPLRAMAMTSIYPEGSARPPEEADVELNAAGFQVDSAVGGAAKSRWSVPVEPVLIDELGHVLGLRDVCRADWSASGRLAPACSAEDRGRVMFASSVNTRPSTADVAELCRLYPAASTDAVAITEAAPNSIHDVGRGLGVSGGLTAVISLVIVALAVMVARRVRRSLRFFKRPEGDALPNVRFNARHTRC